MTTETLMTPALNDFPEPIIGQCVTVYGVPCRIFRIHPHGTIDVEEINGTRAWRMSGLAFLLADAFDSPVHVPDDATEGGAS